METQNRRRGRPKGSRNKPDAGPVGRPRKDGQPPRKRHRDPDAEPFHVHEGHGQAILESQQVVDQDTGHVLHTIVCSNQLSLADDPVVVASGQPRQKKPLGRPKGSKNRPDCGPVGRPRKDGLPPQRRTQAAEASPQISVPEAQTTNVGQAWQSGPQQRELHGQTYSTMSESNPTGFASASTSLAVVPIEASQVAPSDVQEAARVVSPGPHTKRPRGRPKGTKNGPNAGNVGRPRKDGNPPQRRLSKENPAIPQQSSQGYIHLAHGVFMRPSESPPIPRIETASESLSRDQVPPMGSLTPPQWSPSLHDSVLDPRLRSISHRSNHIPMQQPSPELTSSELDNDQDISSQPPSQSNSTSSSDAVHSWTHPSPSNSSPQSQAVPSSSEVYHPMSPRPSISTLTPSAESWFCLFPASVLPELPTMLSQLSASIQSALRPSQSGRTPPTSGQQDSRTPNSADRDQETISAGHKRRNRHDIVNPSSEKRPRVSSDVTPLLSFSPHFPGNQASSSTQSSSSSQPLFYILPLSSLPHLPTSASQSVAPSNPTPSLNPPDILAPTSMVHHPEPPAPADLSTSDSISNPDHDTDPTNDNTTPAVEGPEPPHQVPLDPPQPADDLSPTVQKTRKARTCTKCRGTDCDGRWGVRRCPVLLRAAGIIVQSSIPEPDLPPESAGHDATATTQSRPATNSLLASHIPVSTQHAFSISGSSPGPSRTLVGVSEISSLDQGTPPDAPSAGKRKRSCVHCRSPECKGKWGVVNCPFYQQRQIGAQSNQGNGNDASREILEWHRGMVSWKS